MTVFVVVIHKFLVPMNIRFCLLSCFCVVYIAKHSLHVICSLQFPPLNVTASMSTFTCLLGEWLLPLYHVVV